MSKSRKIDGARSDASGRTTHVRFEGNERYTPVDKAIPIVDRGEVSNAHVVRQRGKDPYIRTNPNQNQSDNIDSMSGDT
jgi:ribosomal protein S26